MCIYLSKDKQTGVGEKEEHRLPLREVLGFLVGIFDHGLTTASERRENNLEIFQGL